MHTHLLAEEAIDESYGVAVVFHEEEERGGGKGETTVAQDDEDEEGEGDEEEGVEADYEGVLHADVSRVADAILDFCTINGDIIRGFPRLLDAVWCQWPLNCLATQLIVFCVSNLGNAKQHVFQERQSKHVQIHYY